MVAHIFIASRRGGPMSAQLFVEALTGGGLSGDRYAKWQVTLIELENIEAFTQATGLELAPEMPRRNIVTTGVRLNALVGQRFRIGDAVLEGLELCEPCSLFAGRTHGEVLEFFDGRGGLRAKVVSAGVINVGDAIRPAVSRVHQ